MIGLDSKVNLYKSLKYLKIEYFKTAFNCGDKSDCCYVILKGKAIVLVHNSS